ncbi:MAG: efflux RND transporter periplasmic adaptor subunit, partial [Pirellulales bacterium]
VLAVGAVVIVALATYYGWPELRLLLNTVSTDDAYVNGHVTFVAARVPGQVLKVLVDDNYRVKKGDLLVQLDPEPYRVVVDIKKAAVAVAEANLVQANAQVRALVGEARAHRYNLEYAMDQVNDRIANLRASVATLNSRKASLVLAQSNLRRAEALAPSGGISKEDLDVRRQTVKVDEASVDEALQAVYAIRASLGLSAEPPEGQDLSSVPPDLDQNYSTVREALAQLIESAAQLGYFQINWTATPREAVEQFYKQDPQGDLNRIYEKMIPNAPPIKQAEAMLEQARSDLEQAELNLSYCDVVSEIDGVVTRRNVNPGNNVQAGEGLMAVRSLREIWIDANFKETQLDYLRIGQRALCEVDMYGSKHEFEGRISGFTMGTGQTLALLPPQNATGNFVKIVQRLPVRIELTDYDPDKLPLFVGLSVEPHVYYKEPPTGPNAGEFLQSIRPLPEGPSNPTPASDGAEDKALPAD